MIGALFTTMRPKQWTKNLLLFAGVIFSRNLGNGAMVMRALWGFLIFCVVSGVIYILNDIADKESDQAHPLKRARPIASGELPVRAAWVAAIALCVVSFGCAFAINVQFGLCAVIYLALMVGYSLHLKHVVVLDLMLLALGFVLRAVAGVWAIRGMGTEVALTSWFIACAFFLALFLAICKRRHELLLLEDQAQSHRPVLEHYSPAFLDQMVSVSTAATVICYAIYTTSAQAIGSLHRDDGAISPMVYTLPFVVYGIFRYLYQVYRREQGGAPENVLLTDKWMIANIVLWLIAVLAILYYR